MMLLSSKAVCDAFIHDVPLQLPLDLCAKENVKPTLARSGSMTVAAKSIATQESTWRPSAWQSRQARQLPHYHSEEELTHVLHILAGYAPLVSQHSISRLQDSLTAVSLGQGFLLVGGDCAESFSDFSFDHVKGTHDLLHQMALIIAYGARTPVVNIARMAGQFAKPRSEAFEERNGVELPSYRGDIINDSTFTDEARRPQPSRMLKAYRQSAATHRIFHDLASNSHRDTARLHDANMEFASILSSHSKYRALASQMDDAFQYMKAINATATPFYEPLYATHECLLLPYEEQLTRHDEESDKWFDYSAHMLWVGERTRQLEGAHLHFAKGLSNPLGIKISDNCEPEELIRLLEVMNPDNIPGRVSVITRMGAEKLANNLPGLIRVVQQADKHVIWVCDPMHGNTIKTASGMKTRLLDQIQAEIQIFFDIHKQMGSRPGGVHLEIVGEDVTECVGGAIGLDDLHKRYLSTCDPRLNYAQSLELAFFIADLWNTWQSSL